MNKVVKKFKKTLQKYYTENEKLMCDELIKFAIPKVGEKNIDLLLALLGEKELENMYPPKFVEVKNEFLTIYNVEMSNLCIIEECLTLFETPYFTLTPELINHFCDIFEYREAERADVLAYFFKKAMNVIMSYDTTKHKDIIEKHAKKLLNSNPTTLNKLFPKYFMKEEIKEIEKSIKEDKSNCEKLNQVIDNDGSIVPSITAMDLDKVMESLGTPFTSYDTSLILNQSYIRALAILKKADDDKELIEQQRRDYQERLAIADEKKRNEEAMLEQQTIAYRIVKKYLHNKEPFKYLNSDELLELSIALATLNYTDEDIMKIQKAILNYNNNVDHDLIVQKLNLTKDKFLTDEQKNIFSSAETIINDPNALNNQYFEEINNNYQLIDELLLEMSDLEDDEVEELLTLVILGFEDLDNEIKNYNMSDYRFNAHLKRTITDNQ